MPFVESQYAVVVRHNPDDDELEVIATGRYHSRPYPHLFLDDLNFKKLPQAGDRIARIGNPLQKNDQKEIPPPLQSEVSPLAVLPVEPGYLELGIFYDNESLKSDSPNRANAYKIINSFPRTGFRFRWFTDLFPHYGIDLQQRSGQVPVQSYYRQDASADVQELSFRFNYRNSRIGHPWRWTLFAENISNSFQTNNPDEAVISSESQVLGLGFNLKYEPNSLLFASKSSSFTFTYVGLEVTQSLFGRTRDKIVTRGTESQTQRLHMQVDISGTFYLPWMPYVKRYFIEASYATTSWKSTFTGPTRSEFASNGYQVPTGGVYSENENGWQIIVGARVEDFISHIFKPKD